MSSTVYIVTNYKPLIHPIGMAEAHQNRESHFINGRYVFTTLVVKGGCNPFHATTVILNL